MQQLISNWGGTQRGQPLADLHRECLDAVGKGSQLHYRLLPAYVLPVADLDATHLQQALRRFNGVGRSTTLQFRLTPLGRFDTAIIPVGRVGEQPDRWLLAIEQGMITQDQVALYGHAVGHLLLNYQEEQMGLQPLLDPRSRYAHADTLAELRLLEAVKQKLDRRVLESYPLLTRLLEAPEESAASFDAATVDLRQQLARAGWSKQYAQMPYIFTAGRVFTGSQRRGARLRVDALLRAATSLPIAIVQRVRAGEARADAARRVQTYARRLAVPYAYLIEEDGAIQEFDWSHSPDPVQTILSEIPGRDALWQRWMDALQLPGLKSRQVLHYPYRLSGNKRPRYYQEAAINSALIAVLQAQRGLRPPRLLITLATGTGKTMVAFQLLWKLKKERAVKNVLFLTDRDFLLSQAMDNEFAPFGDARYRIQGDASSAYDVNFATYQAITNTEQDGRPLYLRYPPDFFDVIVIDECHRGSAEEASEWRKVLKYFASAIQIGLTATPLSKDTVQTDEYFGKPIYSYSLRRGISDGFLAPYRVRRVLIERAAIAEGAAPVSAAAQPGADPAQPVLLEEDTPGEDGPASLDVPPEMETSGVMLTYTGAIAQHLAAFLERTGPFAKTIVFCVNQKHAEEMRVALEKACAAWMPKRSDYITRIVSEEGDEGRRALGSFTTTGVKYPVIVTTSRLLGTGVDVPTCQNIVLAKPVGSIVEFKQIIGRGTRLFEPQKFWFTILDYAGTIKHFFDPDFDGDPELVEKEPLLPEPAAGEVRTGAEEVAASPAEETNAGAEQPAPPESIPMDAPNAPETIVSSSPSLAVHEEKEIYTGVEVSNQTHAAPQTVAPFIAPGEQGQSGASALVTPSSDAQTGAAETIDPHNPPPGVPVTVKHAKDGRIFKIVGEIIFELGPDGSTLRRGSYHENAIDTVKSMMGSPAELRARWRREEQRAEVRERLESEMVDLKELAHQQQLSELDPLDLLLHVVFGEPVLTRGQRVERMKREHPAFFKRFENNLTARATLDIILERYVRGETEDVSDLGLLRMIAEADRRSLFDIAKAFEDQAANTNARTVLKELQSLLYSV